MARAHRPTAATLPCGNLVLICELSVAGGVLHTALASLYCHSNVYHNLLAPLRSNASSFPPFTHSSSLHSPADGRVDRDLLHAALPAVDEKWVAQVWVREHKDPLYTLDRPKIPAECKSYVDVYRLVKPES